MDNYVISKFEELNYSWECNYECIVDITLWCAYDGSFVVP